ncbi:MAG: hypothetical protein LBW77_07725, partial [Verrucomicrobiota bacterium]|jgi:hypothetical protein|nr:hypothetical protein [Verrucomicrobiota bacterium]
MGFGYLYTLIFGLFSLFQLRSDLPAVLRLLHDGTGGWQPIKCVCDTAVIVGAMVLAYVLIRALLPNSTLVLTPKRDAYGQPRFED